MLVVIALVVVIGGLALGIMDETQKASQVITDRQEALQYCQLAIQHVTADLQNAVEASQIPALAGETIARPFFAKNELDLLVMERSKGGALVRLSVVNVAPGGVARAHLERRFEPIAALAANRPATRASDDPGGLAPLRFTPAIRFGYAAAPQPTDATVFQDTWPADSMPALIQVTLTATLDDDPRRPIELQTAVIPGFLPRRSAPATPAAAQPTTTTQGVTR